MDAAIEDALVSWFQAAQVARGAPWDKLKDEQRRAEFARTMLKLSLSADQLFDAVDAATKGDGEALLPRLSKTLRQRRVSR